MWHDIGYQPTKQEITCCGQPMRCRGKWPSIKYNNLYTGFSCDICRAYIKVMEQGEVEWAA